MPLSLEKISAARLATLSRDRTVFFFSTGSMEDHGPHLPLGLDLLQAQKQAELCATRLEMEMPGWTAVLMPAAPLSIDMNTRVIALSVRAHVLRDWLVDNCLRLAKIGFKNFVCFSGHPGPRQLTAIEEAGKIVRRKAGRKNRAVLVSASSALVDRGESKRSLFWPDPIEHGGRRDTSIAMSLSPLFVDPKYRTLPRIDPDSSRSKRAQLRWSGKTSGYWGAPAEADSDFGKTVLKAETDAVFPKLRAVWEGADPENIFRSWYSIVPMNRSFFKAWVLLVLVLLVMTAWLYVSIQAMTAT